MGHPHLNGECELDTSDAEVSCDNVPRFVSYRLMDDGETVETSCQMAAHEFDPVEIPVDSLETITRRMFEEGNDRKAELREYLATTLENRGVSLPDDPLDVEWFVIELTEADVRELEEGAYPEAAQMSMSTADRDGDDMWVVPDDDDPRAMKISGWALQGVPEDLAEAAVPFEESAYDAAFFGGPEED